MKNLKREELIDLIIEKSAQIEKLEAELKNRNGCVLIARIVCKDHESTKQVENNLRTMMQNPENPVEDVTIQIMDGSMVENLYLHLGIQSIKFFTNLSN